MKTVTVIGSGSWGTALAILLARKGLKVTLWGRETDVADAINTEHQNPRYLTGVSLPETIHATTDLKEAAGSELILFVVPSKATRDVAGALAAQGIPKETVLLSCSKGIEGGTGLCMSQIIGAIFPDNPLAALSGPNHAEEIAKEMPGAAVIGSADAEVARRLQDVFTLPWFRAYTSDDVVGIETGGAIKNVFALAAGITEGLGLGDNARAALVTRALAEMTRLGVAMGGKPETYQGLSGVGDLVVTCYSVHSRNHRAGNLLGHGKTVQQVIDSLKMVAEGIPNTESIYGCARAAGVETPIIDQVHAILYDGKPPAQALSELFAREPKPEVE